MPRFPDALVRLYPPDHPDMNAYAILGRCHAALRELDAEDAWKQFHDEATSGDYAHLLSTVRRWFTTYSEGGEWLNNSHRRHEVGEGSPYFKPCALLGWCPFGQLVEAFPVHPEADALAREHGWWVKVEATPAGAIYPIRWVPAAEDEDGALPDLNRLRIEGLLGDTYSCRVFGHDCPAFYLAEPFDDTGV